MNIKERLKLAREEYIILHQQFNEVTDPESIDSIVNQMIAKEIEIEGLKLQIPEVSIKINFANIKRPFSSGNIYNFS